MADDSTPVDAWREKARCRGLDSGRFFPKGKTAITTLKICNQCSVKQECYDYAMAGIVMAGIWGGTTEPERKADKRRGRR